jgi:hypothetical protein
MGYHKINNESKQRLRRQTRQRQQLQHQYQNSNNVNDNKEFNNNKYFEQHINLSYIYISLVYTRFLFFLVIPAIPVL